MFLWPDERDQLYFEYEISPLGYELPIIVPNLARNFPVGFDSLTDYVDVERLGAYGTSSATVVDEFVLPTFGWTREVAMVPSSGKVYFVETDKDRLGELDPASGAVTWHPIPAKGQQGPHTMNSDAEGHIWMGLEDSFNMAAVLRTCEGMGLQEVHVIRNPDAPFGPNSKVTQGCDKWLDLHLYKDAPTCVERLKARGYRVLASTNLTAWSSIATGTPAANFHLFMDPKASNYINRFYRLVTP